MEHKINQLTEMIALKVDDINMETHFEEEGYKERIKTLKLSIKDIKKQRKEMQKALTKKLANEPPLG